MAGEFFLTIGDVSNLKGIFNGRFLNGRREARIAFVGRSNVGKSTLINALLGERLARVSVQPGKTRCVHLYFWKDICKFVADLPGYGFAKAAHTERERWSSFIEAYMSQDEGLERACVLLDARHGPTDLDVEAIRFMSMMSVPVTFVFTKADTVRGQSERSSRRKEAAAALIALCYEPKDAFWVSAKTKDGIRELMQELQKDPAPTASK